MSRNRNLQTEAARATAAEPQSTHGVAAQASAARLIRTLRSCYPKVNSTKTEGPDAVNETQQYLCEYLTHLTTSDITFAKNPQLARNSAISATIRIINHILENYPDPDKKNVLSQMLSIAKTHPGFTKWSDTNKQWSKNKVYNAATKQSEIVTASPAETLNLFCAALFDKRHMLTAPGSDWDKDLSNRIHSLFVHLGNLFKEEQRGNFEYCAAGRQHGILFLLNQVFCESPNQPFRLIEDQTTFAIDAASEFIQVHLESSQDSQEFLSDWILYQANIIQRETTPIIAFLRKRFSSESSMHPDIKWKEAFEDYLKNKFEKFGLDPASIKTEELAANIEYLQPPIGSPLIQELLQLKSIRETTDLQGIIYQRNNTFEDFKSRIGRNIQAFSSNEIQSLYLAEYLFQKIYHNRYQSLLIGADDPAYQKSLQQIQLVLVDIFKTKLLPSHFESVKESYLKALNDLHKRSHYDFIENLFASGKSIKNILNEVRALTSELHTNPFLIADEVLEKWYQDNTSLEYLGAIDVSPYELNRILLCALLSDEYSDQFSQALELISNWLLVPEKSTDSVGKKALKQNYPPSLIQALLCSILVEKNPEVLKDKLSQFIETKDEFIALLQNIKPKHCKMLVGITLKDECLFKKIWDGNDGLLQCMWKLGNPTLTSEQSKSVYEAEELKNILLKRANNMSDWYFIRNKYQSGSNQIDEMLVERLLQGDISLQANDLYYLRKSCSDDQYTKIVCDFPKLNTMLQIFGEFYTRASQEISFKHMITGLKNNEKVLGWLCGLYKHIGALKYDASYKMEIKLERLLCIKAKIVDIFNNNSVMGKDKISDEIAKKAILILEKKYNFSFFSTEESKKPSVVAYKEHLSQQEKLGRNIAGHKH